MRFLFKTTAASAALAAALSLASLPLVAQEDTSDDSGAPGTASDPAVTDEIMAVDESTADPTTGEAVTEGTQTEMVAEEETPEGDATVTTEDDSEDADAVGAQGVVEGEEPEGDFIIEGAPEQVGTELGADDTATADDAAEGDPVESTETGEDEGDTGDRLAATIASAEEAAADVRDAAARLPVIVERIDALVTKVEGLPIEDLVTELTSLATSANTLVSSEATQALPADLSAALGEVEAILREIREGGVIDNANATLQSARAGAETLPGLAARAGVLLDQAGVTLEGFEGSGGIIREAERAMSEVADAADAVASLARAIERDPNSLIFGD